MEEKEKRSGAMKQKIERILAHLIVVAGFVGAYLLTAYIANIVAPI